MENREKSMKERRDENVAKYIHKIMECSDMESLRKQAIFFASLYEDTYALNALERERQEEKKVTELAQAITSALNSSSFSKRMFFNAMSYEHRYLQSEFTHLVVEWLRFCASDDYMTDGRNQWCKNLGRALMDSKLI